MCICHYEMHLGATYPWVFVYLWTLLRSIWRIRDLLSWWRNTKQFWQKIQPKLFMIAVKDDMEYVLQTNSMIFSTACCCRWGSSYPVHWKKSKLSKTWTTWRWPKDNSMFYNVLSLHQYCQHHQSKSSSSSQSLLLLSPSGDIRIGLVWDNHRTGPDQTTHFLVRLLKSSSNWTKISKRSPQLFSGWYQMILDVFQCSQLFSDVFSWVVTFMDNHPLCGHFFSGCPQLITDIL